MSCSRDTSKRSLTGATVNASWVQWIEKCRLSMSNCLVVLAGFPRTLTQAQALNRLVQLDLVIILNVPYSTLTERLSNRWIHPPSGRVYNMGFNPPRVQVPHGSVREFEFSLRCRVDLCCMRDLPQGKDDVTGEPLVQHDDDKPEALMARLRHYKDVAKPVTDLYKSVYKTLFNMPPKILL